MTKDEQIEIEKMQTQAKSEFYKAYGKMCDSFNSIPYVEHTKQIIKIALQLEAEAKKEVQTEINKNN